MRRRSWSIVLGILVLLVALLAFAAWPGSSTFTVSPQTTYVTGPLDKDGYVDYVTALNERLGKGIAPEKNANILICQALGPHPEGSILPAEYFQWLGIDPPPQTAGLPAGVSRVKVFFTVEIRPLRAKAPRHAAVEHLCGCPVPVYAGRRCRQ